MLSFNNLSSSLFSPLLWMVKKSLHSFFFFEILGKRLQLHSLASVDDFYHATDYSRYSKNNCLPVLTASNRTLLAFYRKSLKKIFLRPLPTCFVSSRSISTDNLFSTRRDLRYSCVLVLISSRCILGSRLRSMSCRLFMSSSFSLVSRVCCSHSCRHT